MWCLKRSSDKNGSKRQAFCHNHFRHQIVWKFISEVVNQKDGININSFFFLFHLYYTIEAIFSRLNLRLSQKKLVTWIHSNLKYALIPAYSHFTELMKEMRRIIPLSDSYRKHCKKRLLCTEWQGIKSF